MLNRLFFICLLTLVSAVFADDFDDLSRSRRNTTPTGGPNANGTSRSTAVSAGSDLSEDGKAIAGSKHGDRIGFTFGRDNLGFANLHGAMSLGGMAGNCYTMAVVSKLFFERANWKPDTATPAGFTFDGLATALAQGARFDVNAYRSLFDMSNEPGFGEREVFAHLAREKGIEPGGPLPALTGKQLQISRLMQVISTIHYLHYMQYQAGHFLEAVLRSKMSGTGQVQEVTKREMGAFAAQLDSGRTCLLLMLNTAEVYGHVILAVRMTRAADADLIECYDNNIQHGGETRATVIKILKSGMVEGYYRKEADGKLTKDPIYDGSSWFANRSTLAVILLPDTSLEERDGRALARKIASADIETAYLLASGELLKSLTEKSPRDETLRAGVLAFIRKVQQVQASIGRDVEVLPANADVAAINRVLAARSDLAVRSQFPYALPEGITLTNTRVQLDPYVEDRATVATTITLEANSPVAGLVGVLQKSATLARYGTLADWVQAVRDRVGPTRVSCEVELSLLKSEMPMGAKTRYGVMPYVQRSHLTIGDITPSARIPADHMVEISEKALQGTLDVLLTKLGAIDYTWRFEYVLIPGRKWSVLGREYTITTEQKRDGTVNFKKMKVDCIAPTGDAPAGSVAVGVDIAAFVEVNPIRDGRGINVTATPLSGRMSMDRRGNSPEGHWTVRSAINGNLTVDDGTPKDMLSRALLGLAEKAFPFFANRVNTLIREKLAAYAELKTPFAIQSLDVNTQNLTVRLTEGVVDLKLLARHLFNVEIPANLVSAAAKDDRVILGANYR